DLLFVFFDNDSRVIFASTFDGDWDVYINDFGGKIPDEIDLLFHECEGYPGIHSPGVKDWIVSRQATAAQRLPRSYGPRCLESPEDKAGARRFAGPGLAIRAPPRQGPLMSTTQVPVAE